MKMQLALALLALTLTTPARAADVCGPCEPDIDILVQVPMVNRNYAGPTKYEGDIFDAFGRQFSVEIVIDGTLKPIVNQYRLNPGKAEFVRWTTLALKLAPGPHVMVITIADLAQPTCPDIITVNFATR